MKSGYLVINLEDWSEMVVYTYKKGVMDHTGVKRTMLDNIDGRLTYGKYLIAVVDIEGIKRIARRIVELLSPCTNTIKQHRQ